MRRFIISAAIASLALAANQASAKAPRHHHERSGHRQHLPVTIGAGMDTASPNMFQAAASGGATNKRPKGVIPLKLPPPAGK